MTRTATLTVAPAPVEDVLATGLIEALDADLLARYPGEPINGIDAEEFRRAGGCFVLARLGAYAESARSVCFGKDL